MLEAEKKLKFNEEHFVPKEALERERKMHAISIAERERQMVKAQTSLLIKERLLSEDIKKFNSRVRFNRCRCLT